MIAMPVNAMTARFRNGRWTGARAAGLGVVLLCGAAGGDLHAQWRTQEVPLTAGWNAVFLRVQPEPKACADVFAGLPVEIEYIFPVVNVDEVQFEKDLCKINIERLRDIEIESVIIGKTSQISLA